MHESLINSLLVSINAFSKVFNSFNKYSHALIPSSSSLAPVKVICPLLNNLILTHFLFFSPLTIIEQLL